MTRLALYFVLLSTFSAVAAVDAQTRVNLDFKDVTLHDVIWELQKQTGFVFVYSTQDVESVRLAKVREHQKSVKDVLDEYLENTGLAYDIHNDVIVIRKATEQKMSLPQNQVTIRGNVKDKDGSPLPGVSVQVKGTHSGVATDVNGNFELKMADPKNAVLVFSFVGMKTKEMAAPTNGSAMRVVLEPDQEQLEEVIVTGYGSFKKSAYAGSASTVKTQQLKDVPAVSFAQVLQGAAPGIQINSASGQPGAAGSINIRGLGSFNASNSPLYVIDGVPMTSGDISSSPSSDDKHAGLDIMSTLNVSDIENVTVIKDAAAAALYGSRAANGVILITTKSGKAGKPVFNFKADWGFSDFAIDYREVMSGEERREVLYEGLMNQYLLAGKDEAAAKAFADKNIDKYAPEPWCGYVDWDDVMFHKGSHSSYEFQASGGTEKLKYFSSLGYLKQEGVALNSGLERITGRLNIDYKATDKVTVGAKVLFSKLNQDVSPEGTNYVSPFYSSKNAVIPSDPVYNEDGSWNRNFIRNKDRNPRLSAEYNYDREYVTRSFNTVYGSYEFIKGLLFKTTLSYDYTMNKARDWSDPKTSDGEDENGYLEQQFYEYERLIWSNVLSYQKTFAEKHNLDVLVGYEIDNYERSNLEGGIYDFGRPDKQYISNGSKIDGLSGTAYISRLVSYISRLNYNYDNKYYFGASYRMDGSSRLHRDSRWGSFWSVSGAWKAIAEQFMEPMNGWLSELKLRVSYGVNGTLPSDYYGYMGLSTLTGIYNSEAGLLPKQIRNDDLSWETNYNFNIGLDFGFWNRLNFTVEYYTRTTKDLLMDKPISRTTGFSSYLTNVGEVRNQGVEVEIHSINFDRDDFSWRTDFNIGHNRNKILKLDGLQQEIISGTQIRRIGKPYRTFYLKEFAGINPDNGNMQFYTNEQDENGKVISREITENEKDAEYIAVKCADPKVTGGLSNTLRYKWFDLNFMFSYSFGGYSYDRWAQKTEHGGKDLKANIPTYYRNRWKKPGDKTNIERFVAGRKESMQSIETTRRLHPTDFIRLKNLTFGITLPQNWTKKIGIDRTRFYMSGSNLLTWAKYDYYDPEAVSNGTAIWGTPPLKTMTFGLDINF